MIRMILGRRPANSPWATHTRKRDRHVRMRASILPSTRPDQGLQLNFHFPSHLRWAALPLFPLDFVAPSAKRTRVRPIHLSFPMASAPKSFGPSYSIARERYAAIGVDTEAALA